MDTKKSLVEEFNSFFSGVAEVVVNEDRVEITIGTATLIISLPVVIGTQSTEVFPWVKYLSDDNRVQFHKELLESTDEAEHLIQDWRATAEVESNPGLAKALLEEDSV